MTYKKLITLLIKISIFIIEDRGLKNLYKKTVFSLTKNKEIQIQELIDALNSFLASEIIVKPLSTDLNTYINFLLNILPLFTNKPLDTEYSLEDLNILFSNNNSNIKNNKQYNVELNNELERISGDISGLLLTIKQLKAKLILEESRSEILDNEKRILKKEIHNLKQENENLEDDLASSKNKK